MQGWGKYKGFHQIEFKLIVVSALREFIIPPPPDKPVGDFIIYRGKGKLNNLNVKHKK